MTKPLLNPILCKNGRVATISSEEIAPEISPKVSTVFSSIQVSFSLNSVKPGSTCPKFSGGPGAAVSLPLALAVPITQCGAVWVADPGEPAVVVVFPVGIDFDSRFLQLCVCIRGIRHFGLSDRLAVLVDHAHLKEIGIGFHVRDDCVRIVLFVFNLEDIGFRPAAAHLHSSVYVTYRYGQLVS